MIGQHQIVIDASNFIKGMSSSAQISDGGFSSETEGVNPIITPGVLYAPPSAVDSDTDTRLTDEIIASCVDDDNALGYERKMVTEDGKYYRYNGTKIPEAALRTDATNTYAKGFTDMISYAGEMYITTKQKLVRWEESSATFNASFFSFTNNASTSALTALHPALVFEDNAFYGDGNLLLRQTSAGGTPATILTLAAQEKIIALGIDPSTGRMLISVTNSLNVSGTLSSINKLLWYDGFSNKALKSAIVDGMITAIYPHGGVVYLGYGQNLGYLNGSGITFLRKLTATLDFEDLPYKQNFTHIRDTLYVVDTNKILAFGEIIKGGGKVFYHAYKNYFGTSQTSSFKCIFDVGKNKLGLSLATAKFSTLDLTSVATIDKLDFVSNWYYFPRPVQIRSAYIQMLGLIGSSGNFAFNYKDTDENIGYRALTTYNGTVTSVYELTIIGFLPKTLTALKFRVQNSTENDGLKRIIIYYDYAE